MIMDSPAPPAQQTARFVFAQKTEEPVTYTVEQSQPVDLLGPWSMLLLAATVAVVLVRPMLAKAHHRR